MKELLVVPHVTDNPTLAISDDGRRLKTELLEKAKPILAIRNEKARDFAIAVASKLKAHLKDVEASRVEVKKPFLETSRLIDSTADEHSADIEHELSRINRLVGQFEEDRTRQAREDAEALRLEQKRLSEIVMQPTEELGQSETERGERLRAILDAEEKLVAATEKIEEMRTASTAQKARGGAMRRDWDIEILDIKALYAAHPQCVELTVRNLAVKDLLRAGIVPAGVRATPKVDFVARTAASMLKKS